MTAWITHLPDAEKNHLLARVIQSEGARVRMELLRRFRSHTAPPHPAPVRRTVADLLDDAARRRTDRQRRLAAQRADDEARREHARIQARERRLNKLADDQEAAWSRVEAMIATRKPAEYDAAVTLLTDLQTLAERDGHDDTFSLRTTALRQTRARKPSLIQRLNRAGI
nr:hypothetical protein [Amycolatopsis taiwanensis]